MILFASSVAFGLPLIFTTVQILWINLVTNGIQDIAIAFEKGVDDVMKDKPRATNERIFDKMLIKESLLSAFIMYVVVFTVWVTINRTGIMGLEEMRNYVLLLMVVLQNVHAFNCRSENISAFKIPLKNNPFIIYAVAGALALHLLMMYVPFLQGVLATNPVALRDFVFIVFMSIPLLIGMEFFKYLNKKFKQA
jgi:magnesium-transporting ATPase (P-type)